jgi:glycogen(starch) synthase
MTVLVVSNLYPPDFIGGYELGCRQVVDSLRGRGHEVRVLSSIPRTPVPAAPHVRRRLKLIAHQWDPYLLEKSASVSVYLAEAEALYINANNVFTLIEELEDFRPDVVYLWNLVGLGGLGLVGCLHHLQVPWVWHLMDSVPLVICARQGKAISVLASEFQRQVSGTYLACSRGLVKEIEAGGVRLNGEVEIVPNWVSDVPLSRRTSYLQDGILRIASAGQLARHKGVDLTIAAAGLLKDWGYHNFQVDLFGQAEDSTFQVMVQKLGVSDRVTFRGVLTQPELMRLYEHYDLFAFPTWEREPFGFAPLEAAASGCLPVMSQVCGISEWMVHGVHCLKVPRTAEAFAEIFRQVLDGRLDLEPLGRRASAMVRRDLHLDALIPRIERALERAARTSMPPGGSSTDAYRLALLAEKLTQVLIHEAFRAA